MLADAPRLFLVHRKQLRLRRPWVRGFELFPVFNSDRLLHVSLDAAQVGRF